MRKALDIISVLSFLISGGMACGSFFMYKYVSSPQFQEKAMEKIMTNVKDLLPGQIDKKLPSKTGISLPF
nr:hypothetical protein [uncultured Mediterranean phage uvMED]